MSKIYLDKWYMVTFESGGFTAMKGDTLAERIKRQLDHGRTLPTNVKHYSNPLPDGYITD